MNWVALPRYGGQWMYVARLNCGHSMMQFHAPDGEVACYECFAYRPVMRWYMRFPGRRWP